MWFQEKCPQEKLQQKEKRICAVVWSEKFYKSDLFQILICKDLGNIDYHHHGWGIEQQRLNRNW